jgi:hypothetical protein
MRVQVPPLAPVFKILGSNMSNPDIVDIRTQTKDESVWKLFKAEMLYLGARGWTMLVGTTDDRSYVAPGDDHRIPGTQIYTHEEALKIQKEKDSTK